MDPTCVDTLKNLREVLALIGDNAEQLNLHRHTLHGLLDKARTYVIITKKPELIGLSIAERRRLWYEKNREYEKKKALERYYAKKAVDKPKEADTPTNSA